MESIHRIKTVLAADDSPVALALLSRQLQSEGYRVVTAADGIEAAQQAYRESPDLIVLDITMPRMNGYQVCRLLKRDSAVSHIPVIILTGADSRGTEFWSLRTGADAFLFKSADSAELLASVAELLAQSSSRFDQAEGYLAAPGSEATTPPTPEEILSSMCALMDDELYASTIERIELKTILQNLQDGVMTLNLQREVTTSNQALCAMIGKDEVEMLCWPGAAALGEPAGSDMLAAFDSALSQGSAMVQDSEIRSISGRTTPVAISAVPLRDYLGTIIGGVCLFQDITRRKEREALYEQMQVLDKVKNDLTHMIVHDLRTPLTSLLAGLQTLELSESPIEIKNEILNISIHGGQTLLGMINDLLDVSKMEDGSMVLDVSAIALSKLVSEAIQQVTWLVEEKQLRLSVQVGPEIGLVHADASKLLRVLVNLIGNAIKFSPPGGEITVSACPGSGSQQIVVSVSDMGEGIPREAFLRIFEKFGQVQTRKAGKTMSTGLGLTFCKLVIEAHGGRIWIESEPGHGSTFYFSLPGTARQD
jgi:PAS domain S-box-containing protein